MRRKQQIQAMQQELAALGAELYAGDTVIFVGEKKAKEAVERFLNTEQKTGSGMGP